jgi:integrase
VLRRALGQAVREGIVARNVAGLSAVPRIRAKNGRTLTVDQARQLLEAAAGYRFETAVVLALAYGMRRGEVLGLHWSALDWKAGTLGVTHGVKRVKDRDASSGRRTRLVVSELKTPKPGRTLSLTPELVNNRPMSETVGLTVRSQQTITILLGSCHAGQDPFRVQRYPVLEIDSD